MPVDRERERQKSRRQSAREFVAEQESKGGTKCYTVPEGYEEYKLEPGTHEIDFMPYLAGKNNPKSDKGFECFRRKYGVHWVPDLTGRSKGVICRAETFGQPCAACDYLRNASREIWKAMHCKIRNLWLVNDKPGDKKSKPKVMDTHDKNRGQGFTELLGDAINDVEYEDHPFTLEGGHKARMTVKAVPRDDQGNTYNAATRFVLKPRDYSYPVALLEKMPCLDDCLPDPGYDEVAALLQGRAAKNGQLDDEDEDQPKAKARKAAPPDDDEEHDREVGRGTIKKKIEPEDDEDDSDDDSDLEPAAKKKSKADPTADELGLEKSMVVMYKGDKCIIRKISGDGTSLTLEDDINGEETPGVAPSDVQKIEKKAAAKKPAKDEEDEDHDDHVGGRSNKAKRKKEEPEDDDDEDDSDLEPAPAKKGGKKKVVDEDDDDLDSELEEDDD